METELTPEFIEQNGLSTEQVTAINGHLSGTLVPELQNRYSGEANKNAEKILSGAVGLVQSELKVTLPRNEGEKYAEYLKRLGTEAFKNQKADLEAKKLDYEEKLKNFKGDDDLKNKLSALETKNDELLQQVAQLDEIKGKADKYEDLSKKYELQKREIAFTRARPKFPDTVNKYEADAKWNGFISNVDKAYNLQLVDGEPILVDKENEYKQVKLVDLVAKDETLQELLKEQEPQPRGTGSKPGKSVTVEGVPFKVPENLNSAERSALIRKYLTEEKQLNVTSREYSKLFSEYNKKILSPKKTAA